jgi:hypothetical protein
LCELYVEFDRHVAAGNIEPDARHRDLIAIKTISFGVGRVNEERVDHELFESELWRTSDRTDYKQKARAQLGDSGERQSLR